MIARWIRLEQRCSVHRRVVNSSPDDKPAKTYATPLEATDMNQHYVLLRPWLSQHHTNNTTTFITFMTRFLNNGVSDTDYTLAAVLYPQQCQPTQIRTRRISLYYVQPLRRKQPPSAQPIHRPISRTGLTFQRPPSTSGSPISASKLPVFKHS